MIGVVSSSSALAIISPSSYSRRCWCISESPASSKRGTSSADNSLGGALTRGLAGYWDGSGEWLASEDTPRDSSVASVFAIGDTDGATGVANCDVYAVGAMDGAAGVVNCDVSFGKPPAFLRRYRNQASKPSRMTMAATPTPTPAAAPGESPDDALSGDGFVVVDESGEEVGEDMVGEGLVEGCSGLALAHHVAFP